MLKFRRIAAAVLASAFLAAPVATAQLSDQEVADAVAAMRSAGIPESQIEKFQADIAAANAKMEAFNANPPPEIPDLKSGDELLAQQRAEFEEAYGDAPDAMIEFRDQTYDLKVTTCDKGEGWFVIEAKSEPGPGSSIFGTVLNTNPDGSGYATLDFQTGDIRAGKTIEVLDMAGDQFEFTGPVEVSDTNGANAETLTVTLQCTN
ncbi:MAG: hypothetical protein AAGB16_07295 [Pseudomonadota bacterium]